MLPVCRHGTCDVQLTCNVVMPCMQAAQAETRACKDAVGTAEAEAAAAARRVAEVEEEMRMLLVALDRQKAVSASKMKQLASILQDL